MSKEKQIEELEARIKALEDRLEDKLVIIQKALTKLGEAIEQTVYAVRNMQSKQRRGIFDNFWS